MSDATTDAMLTHKEGGIGWMTFNNPARHNAVSLEMWEAIPGMMADFQTDDEVRVIVLRGAGERAFVSGADISQFEKLRASPEETHRYDEVGDAAMAAIVASAKPTIAMIHGWCMGGGVAIAISCDLRISAESARFGVPAARLGVGYKAPGVHKLMQLVGPSFTKEIFFTGRQFSGQEALGMGLVNRLVPDGQLEDYVREYAGSIAENAPLTLHAINHSVGQLVKDPGLRDMAGNQALVEACFASEDYVEGRRAFMEKRKPVFQGR